MTFEAKILKLGDRSLPPSLPLVVHSNQEWLMEKNQLVKIQEESEGEDNREEEGSKALLKIVPDTLALLKSVNKPIAVVSICGPFRTGKSYLLSQILGSPGAFKVGHSMGACTKGVWMATTVLECEDYVVVLLDTEGMDSPEDESADVSKLLIVTTLLSSLMIYNSQTAPDWNDLEDLSCFSQLSSLIATQGMAEDEYDRIFDNFPNFLWLVRDALELPLSEGRAISPTEYLKTRVLVRSNNPRSTDRDEIVSAIFRLFPSVECRTLPRPSADPEIVTSMELKYDQLEPAFKEELVDLVDYIRSTVRVKKILNMQCNNGTIWAELLIRHVSSINSNKELVLENMYVTAAESALSKLSRKLVVEYKKEMKEALQGKFPMEEHEQDDDSSKACPRETLLSIHNRIMAPKLEKFQRDIDHFLPISNSEDDPFVEQKKRDLLLSFRSEICQLSNQGETTIITDGALHHFAIENFKASKEICRQVELRVFLNVRQKMQHAATTQCEVDISCDLLAAEQEYYCHAIGPAKDEVCIVVRQKLEQDSKDFIRTVPGRPRDLRSTYASNSKIKLKWVDSSHQDIVKHYELQSMSNNDDWRSLPGHFSEQSAIVENLKSNTQYLFQVRGVGKTGIIGNWSNKYCCSTTVGTVTRGAATFGSFLGGIIACPAVCLLTMPLGGPLAIVGGIVGAPILAGMLAKQAAKRFGPQGKLNTEREAGVAATEANSLDANDLVGSDSHSSGVEEQSTWDSLSKVTIHEHDD